MCPGGAMESRYTTMPLALLLCLVDTSMAGTDRSYALAFKLREGYQVIAHGSIGPLEELNLLIDTGAIPSMLDSRIAKKLRLQSQEAATVAFGRRSRSLSAILPDVRLGPLHAATTVAHVGDLSFLDGYRVDAIIGLDLLTRSSFSIDYDRRLLTFGSLVARDPSLHLEVTPPFLTVRVALGGRPLRLLVDTGSRDLVLFQHRMQGRLPALMIRGEKFVRHISGMSRLQRVSLPPLQAGGSTIAQLEGALSDAAMDHYPPEIDGVLG